MKSRILILVLLFIQTQFINAQSTKKNAPILKDKYEIENLGLYPEGIDFDTKNNRFVIGSMYKSEVYTLSAKGKLNLFIKQTNIAAIAGVFTDDVRDRLIIVGGDLGVSKKSAPKGASFGSIAYAEVYNLTNGRLIKSIDLKPLTPNAGSVLNDIAVDKDGNIYITDSHSPIIYKVDKEYAASIFATNDLFIPAPNGFGLNGIVYHPDGYLLVGKFDNSKLYKISISNPTQITDVQGFFFNTPDGLEWTKDNKLIAVGDGKVSTFSSADNWNTANKVDEITIGKEEFPTTAALASNGEVYVVLTKLGKLFTGNTTESKFVVQKIK